MIFDKRIEDILNENFKYISRETILQRNKPTFPFGAVMSSFYLTATETIKPLVFAFPNRLVSMCTGLFVLQTKDRDASDDRVNAAMSLQRMANEMEAIQPSLAAELRSFASRS